MTSIELHLAKGIKLVGNIARILAQVNCADCQSLQTAKQGSCVYADLIAGELA